MPIISTDKVSTSPSSSKTMKVNAVSPVIMAFPLGGLSVRKLAQRHTDQCELSHIGG
jgi:hypothetical protein